MAQRLDVNHEEALALKEALDSYISELGMEIADTDLKDFRERLKERKLALMAVRERLDEVALGA